MKDDAVSSVVSEMLLISLVLILIPSVTITLMNQLPGERVPTVNIKMAPIDEGMVTMYHKGGDYLLQRNLMIVVHHRNTMNSESKGGIELNFHSLSNSKTIFDLGDSVDCNFASLQSGDQIQVVSKKTVIFSGIVP